MSNKHNKVSGFMPFANEGYLEENLRLRTIAEQSLCYMSRKDKK